MVIVNDVAKGTIGTDDADLTIATKRANIRTFCGPKSRLSEDITKLLPEL
jgi:hypothetical protein